MPWYDMGDVKTDCCEAIVRTICMVFRALVSTGKEVDADMTAEDVPKEMDTTLHMW